MLISRRTVPLALAGGCLALATAAVGTAAGIPPSPAALTQLLPRSGEFPGFSTYGAVQPVPTITESVSNDPAAIRASDTAHLRSDGFTAELIQLYNYRLGGSIKISQGLAGVTEFRTQAGADAYQKFTFALSSKPSPASGTAAQTRFVQFAVPGVPGAEGADEISRREKRAVGQRRMGRGQVSDADR